MISKRNISVECPNIMKLYNAAMGDVDLADWFNILVRNNNRFKYYSSIRLIFHMIDMVIVNSWLLYRQDADHQLSEIESLFLKLTVAFSLIK